MHSPEDYCYLIDISLQLVRKDFIHNIRCQVNALTRDVSVLVYVVVANVLVFNSRQAISNNHADQWPHLITRINFDPNMNK